MAEHIGAFKKHRKKAKHTKKGAHKKSHKK
jgi:hypothetical protein